MAGKVVLPLAVILFIVLFGCSEAGPKRTPCGPDGKGRCVDCTKCATPERRWAPCPQFENECPRAKKCCCYKKKKAAPPCGCDDSCVVAGNWGEWGPYGTCSVTCGTGTHERSRICDSPAPKNGGTYCLGDSGEKKACMMKPCMSEYEVP